MRTAGFNMLPEVAIGFFITYDRSYTPVPAMTPCLKYLPHNFGDEPSQIKVSILQFDIPQSLKQFSMK